VLQRVQKQEPIKRMSVTKT